MFSFFKKAKSSGADLSWLGTDMHSHLLPGIDDGARDMDSSLQYIKGLNDLGYSRLVTTPHILWEMYPNTPDIIKSGAGMVQDKLDELGYPIKFQAAAEYFMDEHFVEELKSKSTLLTIKDNLILVEFSMVTAPFDLMDILFELQLQNYQPIIAHPERYIYLRNKKTFFDELKEHGCLFQVNLLSLIGHYGTSVQEQAEYLIKKEYYDYAGTDLHSQRHVDALHKAASSPSLMRLKDSGKIKNHLL